MPHLQALDDSHEWVCTQQDDSFQMCGREEEFVQNRTRTGVGKSSQQAEADRRGKLAYNTSVRKNGSTFTVLTVRVKDKTASYINYQLCGPANTVCRAVVKSHDITPLL